MSKNCWNCNNGKFGEWNCSFSKTCMCGSQYESMWEPIKYDDNDDESKKVLKK